MSDSFIPQFTPQQAGRDASATPQRDSGSRGELVRAPNEIREQVRESGRPVRIRGEVQGQNPDGSTRIRTDRGDVDIRLAEGQARPQTGQRVEIEIPPPPSRPQTTQAAPTPDTPPDTARQQQAVTIHPQSGQAATPTDIEAPPPRTSIETPVRIEVTRPPPEEPIPVRIIPLDAGQEVRLLPLSPALAEDVQQPIAQIIEARTTPYPAQSVQIIPAQTLIEGTTQPTQIQSPAITTAPATTETTAPALIRQVAEFITQALPSAPASPTAQIQIAQNLQPVLQNGAAGQPIAPERPFGILPPPTTQTILQPPAVSQNITTATPQPGSVNTIQPATLTVAANTDIPLAATVTNTDPPDLRFIAPGTPRDAPVTPATTPDPILAGSPQTRTATVIGFIEQRFPVVQLTLPGAGLDQTFVIQSENNTLPVGTQIQLSAQSLSTIPQALPLPPGLPVPASFLTPEAWPAMEQIYQAIARAAPQVAQAFSNITPNAANPAQFGPAALFFIAAIRAGDISSWLGDKAADILRRDGKANLLTRLGQEGSMLSRLGAEPVSGDWRGVSLPLFYQEDIQKMALYYKHDHSENNDDTEKGGQTRFIMNLDLTRIGKVQLDGLARPQKLDLAIRTEQRFSEPMRMQMRQSYVSTLETMGYSGELSFQNNAESWVHINVNTDLYRADA